MRFKLEKMNTYPKNRAINSIFVMLMSQAYNGTVKNRYSNLRLSMPSPPSELYVFSVYFNTYYAKQKEETMPLLFVLLHILIHIFLLAFHFLKAQ
ncbi:Uncharacterised protein [Streptococcus pneumoniae]|nr:Uncharacterised protein [Streptococcus pneumoniae]